MSFFQLLEVTLDSSSFVVPKPGSSVDPVDATFKIDQ